jgi:protein-L-isoaspartate(D-aspartate) O-methyltransferase
MIGASSRHCRLRYAEQVTRLAGVRDPRIMQAFAAVPRENFLPPPPWTVIRLGEAHQTQDVAGIYENVLVAIDRVRGINNGEPALHAAWIDAVEPRPGDVVIHVGAGTGYYTAILAELVEPGGRVEAYEYEPDLAADAADNLKACPHVRVHAASAFGRVLPQADIVYVNAGVLAPDPEWLRALRIGGRLVFPWQPHKGWGPAMLVRRKRRGYSASQLMNVGFITCSGETTRRAPGLGPSETEIARTHSVWLTADRKPDQTASAVYDEVWFSTDHVE